MRRVTKLSRNQIADFAKDPQQIKYFEALQENASELPDAIAVLTTAVAEAQFDADIATASANEALTLANQKAAEDGDFLPEMVMQPPNASDLISAAVVGAATKATPVDADLLPLVDSAAGYTLKNLTWANLKATLKTYFDSVVTTLTNKTIALGSNTISGTLAQFNIAVTDADLASLAGAETLTNKTVALGSNTVSGTLAQFNTAVTDADLASLAGIETLTNKILTAPVINGGTIDNASVGSTTASTGRFTTVTTTTTGSSIVVDGFTAPTLLNSWVNFGAGFNNAGYFKDPFGVVHLRGMIKDGTAAAGTAFFTLPAGYRPTATELMTCSSNSLYAQCRISSGGNVAIEVGTNVWFSLDGITFRAV